MSPPPRRGTRPPTSGDGGASGPAVRSPCSRKCRIDPASGLCSGCLRTLDEIARWGGAAEDERRRILAAVGARAAGGRRRGGAPGAKAGTDPG